MITLYAHGGKEKEYSDEMAPTGSSKSIWLELFLREAANRSSESRRPPPAVPAAPVAAAAVEASLSSSRKKKFMPSNRRQSPVLGHVGGLTVRLLEPFSWNSTRDSDDTNLTDVGDAANDDNCEAFEDVSFGGSSMSLLQSSVEAKAVLGDAGIVDRAVPFIFWRFISEHNALWPLTKHSCL